VHVLASIQNALGRFGQRFLDHVLLLGLDQQILVLKLISYRIDLRKPLRAARYAIEPGLLIQLTDLKRMSGIDHLPYFIRCDLRWHRGASFLSMAGLLVSIFQTPQHRRN